MHYACARGHRSVLTIVTKIGRVLRPRLCVCAGREKKERITPFAFLLFSRTRLLAASLTRDILTTAPEIFRLLSQLSRIYTYCLILTIIPRESSNHDITCRMNGFISNLIDQLLGVTRFWRRDFINFI